jgi:hypothetical protein
MNARFALLFGSGLSLLAAVTCARSAKPPEVADVPEVTPDAGTDAGEGGAGGAPDKEPDHNHPDPAVVQKALDRTGTPTAHDEAAHGLRFEVVEIGPNADWGLAVVNRGSETMSVVFDPRLLSLEVEAPPDPKAKRPPKLPPKPRVCRLPEELRPSRADLGYVVELAPGRGMVEAFDPRLYCASAEGASPLVAGAHVSATFGWAPKTKTVWQHGKRVEEVLPQKAPFVAAVAPTTPGAADGGAAAADAGADVADAAVSAPGDVVMTSEGDDELDEDEGIKELYATPFELGPDYAPAPKAPASGLALEVTQGSDASTEAFATVTVRLSNHGTAAEQVFFRRELVTLEVSNVDGTRLCEPEPDDRSPDRQAFTLLAPGGSISVTSRLAELCDKDTFARPGLYLVRGSFDTAIAGKEFGFDAFVGHLTADKPAAVRIRKGTLPFPGPRTLQEVQVGAAPMPKTP